jgi:hypothetical protein
MSVLYDYFCAPDDETAILWGVGPDGDPERGTSLTDLGVEWLDWKNLDPYVVIAALVDFAATPGPGPEDDGPTELRPENLKDGSWEGGLVLTRIPDAWTATLAALDDEAVPDVAARWWAIEEIRSGDPSWAPEAVREFVSLARRAVGSGGSLYCRIVV